jgi:natural product precursor
VLKVGKIIKLYIMKSIKNIKVNNLNNSKLEKREMNDVKGGGGRVCGCSCWAEDDGGSSVRDNCDANWQGGENGLWSPRGPIREIFGIFCNN